MKTRFVYWTYHHVFALCSRFFHSLFTAYFRENCSRERSRSVRAAFAPCLCCARALFVSSLTHRPDREGLGEGVSPHTPWIPQPCPLISSDMQKARRGQRCHAGNPKSRYGLPDRTFMAPACCNGRLPVASATHTRSGSVPARRETYHHDAHPRSFRSRQPSRFGETFKY